RVAIVQHADVQRGTGEQGVQHQRAGDGDDGRVDDRARPHDAVDRRLAGATALEIDLGVVADEPRRSPDLAHDAVAGVDAQPALDAAELRAFADVDAGRAYRDALVAVDAVACGKALGAKLFRLLERIAWLAAVPPIGDVERPFVGQGRLDARPRAHVDADLL